jgi:hypothetical protein
MTGKVELLSKRGVFMPSILLKFSVAKKELDGLMMDLLKLWHPWDAALERDIGDVK